MHELANVFGFEVSLRCAPAIGFGHNTDTLITLINCISSAGRRGQRSEVAGQRCNHKCKRANSLAPFDTKSELTPSRTDRSSVRLSRKLTFKIAHKLFQFQLAQKILAEAVEPENRKNKQLAGVLNQHAENVDINRTRSEWPK